MNPFTAMAQKTGNTARVTLMARCYASAYSPGEVQMGFRLLESLELATAMWDDEYPGRYLGHQLRRELAQAYLDEVPS